MTKNLVIVESPTKAKTINYILKGKFTIKATLGHVIDLPEDRFGVDLNTFQPTYIVMKGKKHILELLKKMAESAEEVYIATDEDREGEAIAWHTVNYIGKDINTVKRVAFHEITPVAIQKAFENPRKIDLALVNAQQARRILDRIVGYTLSPFLAKKLGGFLSAGRVQSVALRLIVDREREIQNFISKKYWTIKIFIEKNGIKIFLDLVFIDGKKIEETSLDSLVLVEKILSELKNHSITISKIEDVQRTLRPYPPFVTSTLQQESSIRLGFTSSKTMFIAQKLYEGIDIGKKNPVGLITYMRTDSPSVAKSAQSQAFKFIKEKYGMQFVPDKPPVYKAKVSSAQEAHESIRPTDVYLIPDEIKKYLSKEQFSLYELIWKRFIASQMKSAIIETKTISGISERYGFETKNSKIIFTGFMEIWPVKIDMGQQIDFPIKEKDIFKIIDALSEEKQTKPPARYTEASLIKAMEKFGVGRPSTYAPTMQTLYRRNYIKSEKRILIPQEIGFQVIDILTKFFPDILDIGFTAKFEEHLDNIAEGGKDWIELLKEFYTGYKPSLDKAMEGVKDMPPVEKIKKEKEYTNKVCPKCNGRLVIRKGPHGPFLGCENFPKCRYTESIPK
ncbi:MAG: type I DNA topoisomerase [Candidatus Omnitrophica bacterium]|jgi:DNA topoisomerase-1|nr:type I DNA topoisomerase [Candidatus Omnitrophota bacterium]